MKTWILTILFLLTISDSIATEIPSLKHQVIKPGISFRGLCPLDSQIIWVSGNKGTIGKSLNGGVSWTWFTIKGLEKSDFRGIEAVNDSNAYAFTSGTPAAVVHTKDGGKTWKILYYSTDTAIFLDALKWDHQHNKGYLLGDPVRSKFLWAEVTEDTVMWAEGPISIDGEAAFAASNSNISIRKDHVLFISGGNRSALYSRKMDQRGWNPPMVLTLSKGNGKGAFAICNDVYTTWIVGGDYVKDGDTMQNMVMVAGKSQWGPRQKPSGYRSGISWLPDYIGLISCGTNGVDYSLDQGESWKSARWSGSFNTVKVSLDGKATFLAGINGRFARVVMVEEKD